MPTLYRVVYHDPPTREDFLSDRERGVDDPDATDEELDGMSVWDRPILARGLAKWEIRRGYRQRAFVAAVPVEEGGKFRARPSPPRTGHWTLWGDADQLAAVSRIVERYGE